MLKNPSSRIYYTGLIGFLVGIVIAYYIPPPVFIAIFFVSLKSFLFNWQQLIGAFLGASTPISLFIWEGHLRRKKKHKTTLLLLEKSIISAINNLSDIDRMLLYFLDEKLKRYKNQINIDNTGGRHSVGQVFVPLSSTFVFDKEILKETTNSSYLENLMMQVVAISQELPIILKDIDRQFERTLMLNTKLGILKLNSVNVHNKVLIDNLNEFETFVRLQVLGHNIPVYLNKLAMFKISIEKMNTWGIKKWGRVFNFSIDVSVEERSERIGKYFNKEVNDYIDILQKEHFKSRLLKVGDESPVTGNKISF